MVIDCVVGKLVGKDDNSKKQVRKNPSFKRQYNIVKKNATSS